MIYWTPLENQKIFDIVGTKKEVLNPPFEELFLISILSFIIFDQYFEKYFCISFLLFYFFILTFFKSKSLEKY